MTREQAIKSRNTWTSWCIENDLTREQEAEGWGNAYYKGKLLICQKDSERSKENIDRLFIRTVTNEYVDAFGKRGWHDTFTLANKRDLITEDGFYICKFVKYKIDANGYLNLIVEPIKKIEDPHFYSIFTNNKIEETWSSFAHYYLVNLSGRWMSQYSVSGSYSKSPNWGELIKRHPEYNDNETEWNRHNNAASRLLDDWLADKITTNEINDCLMAKTPYEAMLSTISEYLFSVARGTKYAPTPLDSRPLLKDKIVANLTSDDGYLIYRSETTISQYLNDKYAQYSKLCDKGLIAPLTKPVDTANNPEYYLDTAEAVCAYYASIKEARKAAEKAERKAKREAKKAAKRNNIE